MKTSPFSLFGMLVPPLASESNIPYLKTKIRDVKAFFAMENVPSNLLDASHSDWNDMQKLKAQFKFTPNKPGARPKMVDILYPKCLIKSAIKVHDQLIVMRWWCTLDKVQKRAALKELGSIYRAPTTSASPLHKRRHRMIVTSQFDAPEN
jgi:hypothetical protein